MRVWERVGWLTELMRPRKAPIPWGRVVRTGVAVATPVSLGYASGQLGPGIVCSIGALAASLSDSEGPYRGRVVRIGAVALAGTLGFLLGELVFAHPVFVPLLVLAAGAVSGVVSVLGAVASVASLQFLVYVIVASNVSFGPGAPFVSPLFYLLGAAWALALSLLGGIGRRTAPERAAVAAVYRSLAELLEAAGTDAADDARVRLTTAMNEAYDGVVSYRATEAGRDPRVRRLAAVLNASTPLVEAAISLSRDGVRVPLREVGAMREIAAAIAAGRDPRGRLEPIEGQRMFQPGRDGHPGLAVIDRGLAAVADLLASSKPVETKGGRRSEPALERVKDAILSGSATWLPTLRLVLCLAVAELVGPLVPAERPYWIALTVAVTLKPDFGSVFARAVQRGAGTVVGVAIGGGLLLLVPSTPVLLVAIGLFAAALPTAQRRNYGMFATFLTPVIVLLLDLAHGGQPELVLSRMIDTAIGCAIVLLVGYLPWPATWRPRAEFGGRVAEAARGVNAYLRVALGLDSGGRRELRRRAYRGLSDLRTRLQQALSEPPMVSRQAAAWWPVIVALERVTDAVTAYALRHDVGTVAGRAEDAAAAASDPVDRDPGESAGEEDTRQVANFAGELESAIREHRAPADLSLPNEGALVGIAGELRTAASVLAGPR